MGRRLERGGRAVILTYHRVAEAFADPLRLAVHPARFDEQMEVVGGRFRPLALAELVEELERGRVPPRGVAVTFDDGYADNLVAGLPVLERHGVPATVYVTAGYLGRSSEFWWKRIEQLLLDPGDLPGRLEVRRPGLAWSWDLRAAATYPEEEARRHRGWIVESDPGAPAEAFPTARHAAFASLLRVLVPLAEEERDDVVDSLVEAAGGRSPRASHRMLTDEEARRLAESALIDVGAHTLTHPRLSGLPRERQAAEILGSRERLEAVLGRTVTSFAYPFGQARDFTRETVALVREAGFRYAGAVRDIAVSRSSPLYELPRVGVVDCPAEEFERQLEWWLRRGL
jgi:peptidoglycan/xylan/chitin deacetylase (PgdA/CDA1 family)